MRERGIEATVGELALVGAKEMLTDADAREHDEQRRRALRDRLVERIRAREAIDPAALLAVHESGWTRA